MTEVKKSATSVVQHVLQIDDVPKQKREKTTVTSAKFTSRDDSNPAPAEFTLVAYFGSKTVDYLSISLKTCSKAILSIEPEFSVIDLEGILLCTRIGAKASPDNFPDSREMGFSKVLTLDSITARNMAILVNLKYVSYESVPDAEDNSTTRLQNDYIAMFESGSLTDVTFVIQGEEVAAHRNVLSWRSDYFRRMFEAEMKESASNRVEVLDMEPAIFKAMLRFIYGGVLEEAKFEPLAQLIVAADKYGLDELKKKCELAIRCDLRVGNIIDALLLADTANCPLLHREAKVLFKALASCLKRDPTNWNKLATRPFLCLQLADPEVE